MRRRTTVWPFALPPLSDPAAAQVVGLLHQLITGIEYHYREQIHRHQKCQQEIRYARSSRAADKNDPPF
jgi:hypothetical protein